MLLSFCIGAATESDNIFSIMNCTILKYVYMVLLLCFENVLIFEILFVEVMDYGKHL